MLSTCIYSFSMTIYEKGTNIKVQWNNLTPSNSSKNCVVINKWIPMLWTLFVINKITQGLKKNEECCKHVLIT